LRVITAEAADLSGESCAPLATQLVRDAQNGHAMVPFWSSDQLALALLAMDRFGLRPALEQYEIVADDSFGGHMMHTLGGRLGLRMRSIHGQGDPRRMEDLSRWIRNPGPFFLAVDGGTRYGTVPTGTARLAARLRARLWPVAVRAWPRVRIPGLIADIPLPGAKVVLAVAAPLVIERQASIAAAVAELKHRLDVATRVADELLKLAKDQIPTEAWSASHLWRRTG
jgi:hypothetical protein